MPYIFSNSMWLCNTIISYQAPITLYKYKSYISIRISFVPDTLLTSSVVTSVQ